MKKFEYYLLNDFGDDDRNLMSALGKEGWELVCVACNSKYNTLYFKRELI